MTIFTTNRKTKLITFVKVGNRIVKVKFAPPALFGNVGKAEYVASSEVAKALKADPMFGVEYFVKSEIAEPTEAVNEELTKKEVDYYALCDASKIIYQEDSVVDVKTAQNWLQREHGAVFKARKAEAIKEEAAKVYNTVFINWK